MNTENLKNVSASVHQRLLNKARKSSRPFNELLQHYAIERFLYRLSMTPYAEKFFLKGALMFSLWRGKWTRPTMDIDLLGKIDNSLETIVAAIKEACAVEVEADGMFFDQETVNAERIVEDALYEGVRVGIQGLLGNARINLQVDIGFGDEIVPEPCNILYPALLNFPSPALKSYTMESTIAEKFQAMAKLGVLNSRMKDFYDIWMLSRSFDFSGKILSRAIFQTFSNRNTPIHNEPAIFNSSFVQDKSKSQQWQGFIRKAKLVNAPGTFEEVVEGVRVFLGPVTAALARGQPFHSIWYAPGPWRD